MNRQMIRNLLAGAVLAGCSVAYAQDTSAVPSTTELQQQIKDLQREMDQMRADRAAAGQAYAAVEHDAARHSGLLNGGQFLQASGAAAILGGMEKGKPLLRSEDGRFTLSPTLQMQLRNVTNYIDDDGTGQESIENGFEIRRAKFGFAGKVAGDWSYKFVWATNRDLTTGGGAGNVFLEDAQVSYKINDHWAITGGQWKDPVHHEELVSSSRQMAADRSLVNEQLGGGLSDRIQGVGVAYSDGPVWLTLVGHDGANSDNRSFRDPPSTNSDWGVAGRIQFTVFGEKKQYADFSAMGNKDSLLVIGAGGDVSGLDAANRYLYTVDAQWENTAGTGVYAALLGTTLAPHGDGDEVTDVGGLIQVSQMVSEQWEVFGRYGAIDFDAAADLVHEITLGANRYYWGHGAKLTMDVVVLPEGSPADTGLGYLGSGDELQVVGRVQFQLAI